jgi:diadenosine tetraphosphatase ApaH/serine/threonine PP2A family protein phosphatase
MKLAIFGDIHANLEALERVLADAADQGVEQHACIGDVVGYNANPHECMERVRGLDCPVVKGNHDEEASLDTEIIGLNPLAQAALEWTRDHLTEEDKQWLRDLRMVRQVRDFTIVHATLDSPGQWHYVMNKFDAMASFRHQYTQLCFYGHTHTPRVYVKEQSVTMEDIELVRMVPGRKYFINVGSVGQPRDGDPRCSYGIYDDEEQTVQIRRLDYDITETQRKIREGGLPEPLAGRLDFGK